MFLMLLRFKTSPVHHCRLDLTSDLFMELSNEPELHFQAGPTFLSSNVAQQVLMLHPWRAEHISLVLPRLLILKNRKKNQWHKR